MPGSEIEIEFDEETQSYYAIWQPVIIGWGKTQAATLEDLRQAAHFGTDSLIDIYSK